MDETENLSLTKKQLRVALYLRVSTEDQADKYGLEAQETAIRGLIQSKGKLPNGDDAFVLAGKQYIYKDDLSGTTDLNGRPGFNRLMEDIAYTDVTGKPFDVVAVYKIDRFARKLKILLNVLDFFRKYKVDFVSATESIDTSTPFGRAMLGIMGVIAELELETIKQRTTAGKDVAHKRGVVFGAYAKFGYTKDVHKKLILLPEEAEVVKKIFQLFVIEKKNYQQIANYLTDLRYLSPEASSIKHGKRKGKNNKKNYPHFWRSHTVKAILQDEIYLGRYYYDKTINNKPLPKSKWKLSPHRHEAIVEDHEFYLAEERIKDISSRKILTEKKQQGQIYLLSSLLKCDCCKSTTLIEISNGMDSEKVIKEELLTWVGTRKEIGKGSGNYSLYYKCGRKNSKKYSDTCKTLPLPAEPIEKYVLSFVKDLLEDPRATYAYYQNLISTKTYKKSLKAEKDRLIKLLNAIPSRKKARLKQHELKHIGDEELNEQMKTLKAEEKQLSKRLSKVSYDLTQQNLTDSYFMSLKAFSEKYTQSVDELWKDRKKAYDLIHDIVHKIVVFSRPVNKNDVVAGRKTKGQQIPERVDVHLKLPKQLLNQLYQSDIAVIEPRKQLSNMKTTKDFINEFVVKNSKL